MNENTTEAAELARIILDDSEGEHPIAMYALNVHEARTLANVVARVEALADCWESAVSSYDYEAAMKNAAMDLRAALNGGPR